jgi:hypothetical protein
MANASFDDLWNEAMGELDAQLHVEGVDGDGDGDAKGTVSNFSSLLRYKSVPSLTHFPHCAQHRLPCVR